LLSLFFKLVVLFFVTINSSFSTEEDLRGIFSPIEARNMMNEGEVFAGKLVIHPLKELSKKSIYSLEGRDFLGMFQIVQITSVMQSNYNKEAYEIRGDFVFKKIPSPETVHIWSYLGLNIPVQLVGFGALKPTQASKEFILWDGGHSYSSFPLVKYLLISLLIIGLPIGVFVGREVHKNNKEAKKKREQKEYMVAKLRGAVSISELSNIYLEKKDWQTFLDGKGVQIDPFLEKINEYQYRPDISDDVVEELTIMAKKVASEIESGA